MKTHNLVNGYVLSDLFYELMFLHEHGIEVAEQDWSRNDFVDDIIRRFVVTRFGRFKHGTKEVVKNTLGYLLVTEEEGGERWEAIWQLCSAPIPTPGGIKAFMARCHAALFPGTPLPTRAEIHAFSVRHDFEMANLLN